MKTLTLDNLTPEQYSTVEAFAHAVKTRSFAGIEYQGLADKLWHHKNDVDFSHLVYYRLKPTPKLRAWKDASEVPLGAWIRHTNHPDGVSLIMSFKPERGIGSIIDGKFSFEHPDIALVCREYSTDNGATWKPCGVLDSNERGSE